MERSHEPRVVRDRFPEPNNKDFSNSDVLTITVVKIFYKMFKITLKYILTFNCICQIQQSNFPGVFSQ